MPKDEDRIIATSPMVQGSCECPHRIVIRDRNASACTATPGSAMATCTAVMTTTSRSVSAISSASLLFTCEE